MNNSKLPDGIKPGVINIELIQKCVLQNTPIGESSRLLENNVQLHLITILRLDFLNIYHIDCLMMLKSLKKLSMTHNKIEKIENLDGLINLSELDLSFNEIKKIENVEKLINIQVLMLNYNHIEIIENMESLKILTILGISGNSISNFKEMMKLRFNKKINALSFKNNPCCDEPECNNFIIAVLPHLIYINYIKISSEERSKCELQFCSLINALSEIEENIAKEEISLQKAKQLENIYYKSFVELLQEDYLLKIMFKQDNEGFILLNGGTLITFYNEYKSAYKNMMIEFVEYAQNQYIVRKNEIRMFKNAINKARKKSTDKSRIFIEIFMSEKFKISKENIVNKKDEKLISKIWIDLINEEMILYEQCEKTREEFFMNMNNLIYEMIKHTKEIFMKWENEEIKWITNLKEYYLKMIENKSSSKLPEIQYLLEDPDVLIDIIELSKHNHFNFINEHNDILIGRMEKWLNDLTEEFNKEEIQRNRSRILEISLFVEKNQF